MDVHKNTRVNRSMDGCRKECRSKEEYKCFYIAIQWSARVYMDAHSNTQVNRW